MGNWWDSFNDWWNSTDQAVIDNVISPIFNRGWGFREVDKMAEKKKANESSTKNDAASSGSSGSSMSNLFDSASGLLDRYAKEAQNQQSASYWEDIANSLSPGGPTGGSYDMQGIIDQINESYMRQQQALDQARSAGQQGIQGAYNTFSGNIGRNYADYTGATQQAQAAMAQRVADQIAQSQARQAELQRSAQAMGQDYGALTQQQAGNIEAMRAAAGFQQDLGQRMAQIVANNQRALEGSGELVRQGAMGNLETNYQALLGALLAAREQQIMNAQAAASSGGGGGSSKEVTLQDVLKERQALAKLRELDPSYSKTLFDEVSPDKLWEAYLSTVGNDSPEAQSVAQMVRDRLAQSPNR